MEQRLRLLERNLEVLVEGAGKFVVEDALQRANVGWKSSTFEDVVRDRVEEHVSGTILAVSRLLQNAKDDAIRAELGNRAEIKLVHFFGQLEKQADGNETGIFLVNGIANIAFIMGDLGYPPCTMTASWIKIDKCWGMSAYTLNPNTEDSYWYTGISVLSVA